MLTEYTPCSAVRAVLGVSSDEVEDSVLELDLYLVLLEEDLAGLASGLTSGYAAARVLASPTAIDTRFVRILQTYASYQVAETLLTSLKLFAPKDISDGKASAHRVADPFKDLRENVAGSLSYIRGRLLNAYAAYNPAYAEPETITRILIRAVGLGVDPVTG